MAEQFPTTFPRLIDAVTATMAGRVFLQRRHARGGDPVTFRQLGADVRTVAAGLVALGIARGDRVGLIADNRYEWLLADFACASIGAIDVPRGSDTAPTELVFIMKHSGCALAFVDSDATARTLRAARAELTNLGGIVTLAESTEVEGVLTLRELMQRGLEAGAASRLDGLRSQVEPEDLLTIVYTSGTTAEPKGVMLSHRNVLSNIRAANQVFRFSVDDTFLSVLPAWHMYERILDYVAFTFGATMVYSDRRNLKEDLAKVQPTTFAGVPRIWEVIHDGIVNHCHKLRGLKRLLLERALATSRRVGAGTAGIWDRVQHAFFRRTVLPKLRMATGGRLRFAVSGGGSLPRHVDELFLGIGIPLLNGYGLTETSPVAAVRVPSTNRPGTIGPPLPGTEIEIRDFDRRPVPDGAIGLIWIRGPQVMRGYYQNEQRTREVIDAQGWFNSGDLGCRERDGQIRITGRAKDTIVLASGENTEPEPIESVLKTSPLIQQVVVVGQDQKVLGAILVPCLEHLERALPRAQWGERDGVLYADAVKELMRAELDRLVCRTAGFRPHEKICAFRVLCEPLTVENGFLTQTMKTRRHVVHERLQDVIAGMFAN